LYNNLVIFALFFISFYCNFFFPLVGASATIDNDDDTEKIPKQISGDESETLGE